MPLPTHQAGDCIAGFHASIGKQPVLGQAANPVSAASHRTGAVRADQFIGVGPLMAECFHLFEFVGSARGAKNTHPFEGLQLLVE